MAITETRDLCVPSPRTLDRLVGSVSRIGAINDRIESVLSRFEGVTQSAADKAPYGGSYTTDINELENQVDRLNNLVIGLEAHA